MNLTSADRGISVDRADHWQTQAACAQPKNADAHFPHPTDMTGQRHARKVCQGCPVRRPCLAWALQHDIRDGVWGGLGPRERGKLARRADAEGLTYAQAADAEIGRAS